MQENREETAEFSACIELNLDESGFVVKGVTLFFAKAPGIKKRKTTIIEAYLLLPHLISV